MSGQRHTPSPKDAVIRKDAWPNGRWRWECRICGSVMRGRGNETRCDAIASFQVHRKERHP